MPLNISHGVVTLPAGSYILGGYVPMSRFCIFKDCKGEVLLPNKDGGYCNAKHAEHYNPGIVPYDRPKCACGSDSLVTPANPSVHHSTWCPVFKWQQEPYATMYGGGIGD
jgi:hypothetical protein